MFRERERLRKVKNRLTHGLRRQNRTESAVATRRKSIRAEHGGAYAHHTRRCRYSPAPRFPSQSMQIADKVWRTDSPTQLEHGVDVATLEVQGSFTFLPNLMLVSFGDPDTRTSETHIIKVSQGFNIDRLERVSLVAKDVARGYVSVDQALRDLTAIRDQPPMYPWYVMVATYTITSAAVAPLFFGGTWPDAGIAGFIGGCVGLASIAADKYINYANIFEISCAIFAGFISAALNKWICFSATSISGLVMLLPGLSATNAIMELISRSMVAGAVRFFYSLVRVKGILVVVYYCMP